MLTYYHGGREYPLENTEYRVRELASGLDEVIFDLSIYDPAYAVMAEEEQLVDRGGQRYKVTQIDGGADRAKVICTLDLDEWRSTMMVDWSSGSVTVAALVEQIAPSGWLVEDLSLYSIRRTISGSYTPLQVCEVARSVYQVYFRWDTARKKVRIYPQAAGDPVGAFATRELNLREIQYKGKSNDLITRLYPYGKKDDSGTPLTIQGALIDGQPYPYPYVEDHGYTSKTICAYWIDERYTDAQSLYRDAVAKLRVMAYPVRSYECEIIDLQATNPEIYGNLDFSLFTAATLIDDVKNIALPYKVVERVIYPYHPERNEVILSAAPAKITNRVTNIVETIENPQSEFRQTMDAAISNATQWMTSGDGYVVAVKDTDGTWKELLFMDAPDTATAQNVLRINENGIGFSTTGVNGQYTNAWTIDGNLVADFITTGTMSADRVRTGSIQSVDGNVRIDLDGGYLLITAPNLVIDQYGTMDITNAFFKGTQFFVSRDTSDAAILSITNKTIALQPTRDGTGHRLTVSYDTNGYPYVRFYDGSTQVSYFGENSARSKQLAYYDGSNWQDVQSKIDSANSNVSSLASRVSTAEGRITTIAGSVGDLANIVSGLASTQASHTNQIQQLATAYSNLQQLVYSLHGLP